MFTSSNYYIARQPRLLNDFDRIVKMTRPVLGRYFEAKNVSVMAEQTRQEYARIIPHLPYIGGKQPFTQFIISTGMLMAVYRVAKTHGKTVEETGRLVYEISQAYLQAYPTFLTRFLGNMNFSNLYLRRLRRRADESHRRQYVDDYVYNFVAGDGKRFDYGVDYLECASCKFLAQQEAAEFAPYLCPVDILYSEALGWGLTRSTTLAEGAEKCDFRFKKGGPTQVAVPYALRSLAGSSGR